MVFWSGAVGVNDPWKNTLWRDSAWGHVTSANIRTQTSPAQKLSWWSVSIIITRSLFTVTNKLWGWYLISLLGYPVVPPQPSWSTHMHKAIPSSLQYVGTEMRIYNLPVLMTGCSNYLSILWVFGDCPSATWLSVETCYGLPTTLHKYNYYGGITVA